MLSNYQGTVHYVPLPKSFNKKTKEKNKRKKMSQTTIAKAHKIARDMHSELVNTGAIDAKNNVVKSQMFIDIIEHAESELNKLVPEVESEAGVVIDRNAANIVYNYFDIFKEMKQTMSVHPELGHTSSEEFVTKESKAPRAFKSGIKKMFGKIKSKFTPTIDKSETR